MPDQTPPPSEVIRAIAAAEAAPERPWLTPAQVLERCPELASIRTREFDIESSSPPATRLPARLYLPEENTGAAGLIWIYGGGFIAGHLDMPDAHWVALWLAQHGTPVLTLSYRKALDGIHFPTPADDIAAGWRWAHEHHELLGTDRLHAGGASAGGTLAAALAELALDGRGPMPASLLLAYPALHPYLPEPSPELATDLESHATVAFQPDVHREIALNYVGEESAFNDPIAFPGLRPVGFPPTIIRASQYDDLRACAERFTDDLIANGCEVDYAYEPGVTHGYLNRPEDEAAHRAAISTLTAFNAWLARAA